MCVCPLYQSHRSAKTLWESGFNFFFFWMAEHFFISFVIFLLSHLYRNCDNKFHSQMLKPRTQSRYWSIETVRFFFCEHDWLMKSNGFQIKILFFYWHCSSIACHHLLRFQQIFSNEHKHFFFNQLIVFYWVIPQNVEHDSLKMFSSDL